MANETALDRLLRGEPGLYHLFVRHDDWCLMLAGGEVCNCNPEQELVETSENNGEAIARQIIDGNNRLKRLQDSRKN